jgi:hypothetical protein
MSPVMIGLLLCTIGVVTAEAATLSGVVMNRTEDRTEAGVAVQLVHHSAQSAEVLADTTDAEGKFSFEVKGEPSAEVPMMLSAVYKDVPYRSGRVTDLNAPVEIAVYESTDSDAVIEMISHHLIVDASTKQATQILIFRNTGNRTFKTGAGHGHGIEVPLPVGVTDVQSDVPGVHAHGPTLVDSRPVAPGRMQLSFTTPIPADGNFRQFLKYATPSIDAFITPSDFQVTDNTMTDLGDVDMGERKFRRLLTENVEAGGQVSFRLAFTSTAAVGGGGSGSDVFDGASKGPWALGGMAIGALLALAYLKMGSKATVSVGSGDALSPEVRRVALIQQIADLDDRLDQGDLTKDEHEKRRDALKAEVVDLTQATSG